MATARIDLMNMALGHLRQQPLREEAERTEAGRYCRMYFDDAVRSSLRAFDWPFARAYSPGAAVVATLAPGWLYSFALPADCLRLRDIARPDKRQPRHRFELIGQTIQCNVLAPVFVYTREVLDPMLWDATFIQAASYQLALQLAMPLTGKAGNAEMMRKMLAQALSVAQTEAANEEPNDINQDRMPDWLLARGYGGDWRGELGVSSGPPGASGGVPGNGGIVQPPAQTITVIVDGGNIGAGS